MIYTSINLKTSSKTNPPTDSAQHHEELRFLIVSWEIDDFVQIELGEFSR